MEYTGASEDGREVAPVDLTTRTETDDGTAVVSVAGDVDLSTCDRLRRALNEALQTSAQVVIDFAALTFIDSSGLSVLVEAHRSARDAGGVLVLRNITPMLRRLLDITRLDTLLVVEEPEPTSAGDEA